MANFPKPWRRGKRGWYVTLDGRQISLGKSRDAAFQAYHDLMRQPQSVQTRPEMVAAVVDRFLDYVQKHRAADTYVWYQSRLQLFVRRYPSPRAFARLARRDRRSDTTSVLIASGKSSRNRASISSAASRAT